MKLVINNKEYCFRFGIGFIRYMDDKVVAQRNGVKFGMGLDLGVPKLMLYDTATLSDMLLAANNTECPKISQDELDVYIENKNTDILGLFNEVLTELKNSNATRLKVANIIRQTEIEEARQEISPEQTAKVTESI